MFLKFNSVPKLQIVTMRGMEGSTAAVQQTKGVLFNQRGAKKQSEATWYQNEKVSMGKDMG